MSDYRTCQHQFERWFGPVLKCRSCGATTNTTADPRESKPIFPPGYDDDLPDEPATLPGYTTAAKARGKVRGRRR